MTTKVTRLSEDHKAASAMIIAIYECWNIRWYLKDGQIDQEKMAIQSAHLQAALEAAGL
jgi:hypothetical protein